MKQVPTHQYQIGGQYYYGVDSDYPNAARVDIIDKWTHKESSLWVIPVDQWHKDNPRPVKEKSIGVQRNPMPRKNPCKFTPSRSARY